MTVLLAEHRLERVVQYADRVRARPGDRRAGRVRRRRREVLRDRAGRAAGRRARPARRLGAAAAVGARRPPRCGDPLRDGSRRTTCRRRRRRHDACSRGRRGCATSSRRLRRRSSRCAASTSTSRRGEVVALMGRNGAGKSTLLAPLVGPRRSRTPARVTRRRRRTRAGCPRRRSCAASALVPQEPGDLLYADTVAPSARRRPGRRRRRRHPARAARAARARHRRRTRTRATCPRASGCAGPGRRARRDARRCCCSTSRPAAWTTPPRHRLVRDPRATWPRRPRASCSPPTTSSWSPRSPPGWSCWPTARSSPTGRPREVVCPRRRSRRRWPRSWRRCRG